MTFDGGTVTAKYVIDYSQAQAAAAQIKGLYQGIQIAPVKVDPNAFGSLTAGQSRAAQTAAQMATEQQKAAVQAQRLATEEQKTAVQAANVSAAQDRAAITALRLANAQQDAAGKGNTLTQSVKGLQSAAGAIGIGLGLKQVVDIGIAWGGAALSLRETENALRAVAGSQTVYNQIIAEAHKQQLLFGGTLEENIDGLRGLAVVSRSSGADLAQLVDLQKRLATLDPEQGARGGLIALNEALSGNVSSISRRFEIPKQQLQELTNTATPAADRLRAIDEFLNKVGITSQSVADKVDKTALKYRELGAAADNAKVQIGGFLADALVPLAETGTNLLGAFQGTQQGFTDFTAGAQSFARVMVGLPPLTNEQQKAQEGWTRSILEWISAREVQLGLLAAPTGGGGGGSFQFTDPAQTQQATAAQRAYAESLELTGVRARAAQQAAEQKSAADQVAAVDAQTHAIAQGKLADEAGRAADKLIAAGPAGARTAAILAQSSSDVDTLTAAYYRLKTAQGDVSSAPPLTPLQQGLKALRDGSIITANEISDANTRAMLQASADAQAAADQAARDAKTLADLQFQGRLNAAKTTAQKIAVLQDQLAHTTDAIERQRLINQIEQEKNSGAGRVSAAQTTGLQLANVEENTQAQIAKAQREGLERLRDQQQDFDLKRSRSEEDEARKIQGLLARGQRAQAAREREDFAREQKRAREDFDIQRQRTLRNNAEQLGDITGGAERRSGQITQRAALRGVPVAGGSPIPVDITPTGAAPVPTTTAPRPAATLTIQGVINIDGKAAGTAVWPTIQVLVDQDLAISLQAAGIPGSGQSAVGGAG